MGLHSALTSLPEFEPPRSYRLTAADVSRTAPAKASGGRRRSPSRAIPALAGMAIIAFAALIVVDLRSSGSSNSNSDATFGLPAARDDGRGGTAASAIVDEPHRSACGRFQEPVKRRYEQFRRRNLERLRDAGGRSSRAAGERSIEPYGAGGNFCRCSSV